MTSFKKRKGLFTRTVDVTIFVSGIFDLFDVTCKQHHRTTLNPFLNGAKNGDVDAMCKSLNTMGCATKSGPSEKSDRKEQVLLCKVLNLKSF